MTKTSASSSVTAAKPVGPSYRPQRAPGQPERAPEKQDNKKGREEERR